MAIDEHLDQIEAALDYLPQPIVLLMGDGAHIMALTGIAEVRLCASVERKSAHASSTSSRLLPGGT